MTAVRWLKILRYSFQQHYQGIYHDRHERLNILQYKKEFLEKMFGHKNICQNIIMNLWTEYALTYLKEKKKEFL